MSGALTALRVSPVLGGDKGCRPFPAPLSPLAASFLRCAPERFLLTKPNALPHNRLASVATLRWCSESSRNAVRHPSGTSLQLRRNPQGKISFPFRARCVTANSVSPLPKGENIEIFRMAAEDACEHDMFVQIRWQGRKMAVSLSQLDAIDPDESTKKAIGDWHYRLSQGYCL